ncbi:MAG: sulfurtransferase [Gammaproteobacteria bacterium]|jgi:thiosulfate/3-mercaptopyruvate sulfurtransferase
MTPAHDTLVDVGTLATHLDDPNWVVFDCRFDLADTAKGRIAHAAAHVPGARYAHLDDDLSGPVGPDTGRHPLPDPRHLVDWFGRQGVGPGSQVVAYDDTGGNMAVRVWWLLRWLGHRGAAVLDGGWPAWTAAGLPVDAATPTPAPAAFAGMPDESMVLGSAEILADLNTGRWLLIDARTAERFRGEAEPIDPVAGRIPGAVNLPLQQNLRADGRFLPADRLHALYAPLLAGRAPETCACMCGSGVTACHDLLAMEIAGLRGARLYAGSWSEWIRDPSRPVASG